jgi:hypothetical protein
MTTPPKRVPNRASTLIDEAETELARALREIEQSCEKPTSERLLLAITRVTISINRANKSLSEIRR